jgi:hypothetical protein
MSNKAVMTSLEVLSQHLPGMADKNMENLSE